MLLALLFVGEITTSAVFGLDAKYMSEFAENNILYYDPDYREGGQSSLCVDVQGCEILAELRTAMWNAASEQDKNDFYKVTMEENEGISAVEGYMNQIISKHGSDGTLHDWLYHQCEDYRPSDATCTNKGYKITAKDQKIIDEALGGSNNIRFAIGNATGGATDTGAGKIVCVWNKEQRKCRDDVDYTKQNGYGVCAVYSPSSSFGECWGDEYEGDWVKEMKQKCKATTNGKEDDGSNITLIGDSIADGAKSKFLEAYPKTDAHTKVSKQFYAPSPENNPAGIDILKKLVDKGKLRRTLIYALGTNSNGLTKKQAEEVIELAGDNTSVIFLTNYEKGKDFTNNNNVLKKMKKDHSNVEVIDWAGEVKGDPDKYLSDGTHPNAEGVELWVKLLSDALNGSKRTAGCGVDVPAGEAAGVKDGDPRWKYLFPDGVPTSSSQMEKYLVSVKLNILNEKGEKDTITLRIHKKLASEVEAVFDEMVAIGFKIKKSGTSSYNWRTKRGSSNISIHAYGAAIDINADDNPYKNRSGYKPGVNEYAVTDEVIKIWKKHGFNWGGYFSDAYFDAMHFTYLEKGSKEPD